MQSGLHHGAEGIMRNLDLFIGIILIGITKISHHDFGRAGLQPRR
jgi:hypothetical protein